MTTTVSLPGRVKARHLSELTPLVEDQICEWWQTRCAGWPLHGGIYHYLTTHGFWFNPEDAKDRDLYDDLYRRLAKTQSSTVLEQLSFDLLKDQGVNV